MLDSRQDIFVNKRAQNIDMVPTLAELVNDDFDLGFEINFEI